MPFGSIKLRPGVATVATPTLNEAGISDCQYIRFRYGLPEKIGGWSKYLAASMGSITRALHAWQDLNSNKWLAAGNVSSLKVMTNGAVTDITPQIKLTNPSVSVTTTIGVTTVNVVDTNISNVTGYDSVFFNTPIAAGGVVLSGIYQIVNGTGTQFTITSLKPATSSVLNGGSVLSFSTTSGSAVVTVNLANHGLSDGDKYYFPISTIANGITISGVQTVTSATITTFTIVGQNVATATGTVSMNGGNAQLLYYISAGPAGSQSFGALGAIGEFAIGEGYSRTVTITAQTGTAITSFSDWTLADWGEILLACSKGGPIYFWRPLSGFSTATPVGSAPPQNNFIFVSSPQQILVALGSAESFVGFHNNTAVDPLIVRWSDNEDFFEWHSTTQTGAGSFHISSGSKIMGGIQCAEAALILTDKDAWSMTFVGYPLMFAFLPIGIGNGLLGPHALATMRGIAYWVSQSNFVASDGKGIRVIPCPIWDTFFQDLDTSNATKIVAGANEGFNEIFFFYPSISGGTGENDKYVKYNIVENAWDYGPMNRSAWIGQSVLGTPIGADPTTYAIQQHEIGYDADGTALDSYYESGYAVIADGEDFAFVDQFIPDMKYATLNSTYSATLNVSITATSFPSGGETRANALTMTSTTQYLSPRLRGRQMKWRVGSTDAGTWWRQGNIRYRYAKAGRVG